MKQQKASKEERFQRRIKGGRANVKKRKMGFDEATGFAVEDPSGGEEHDMAAISPEDAENLSFVTMVPKKKVVAFPDTGVHAIPVRPPTRGGTNYDQFHKRAITLADKSDGDDKYKKTAEEMFEMKMQLKYGSPLVAAAMEWGHDTEWRTTMRPEGAGVIKRTQVRRRRALAFHLFDRLLTAESG